MLRPSMTPSPRGTSSEQSSSTSAPRSGMSDSMLSRRLTDLAQAERFQLLIGAVKDYAIYLLDAEGRVATWNTGAQLFKGYTADEIIGRHFSTFYTEEDRAIGMPERALRTAAEAGRFESEGWRVRKDGTRFWSHVVIDPVIDADETDRLRQDHPRRFRTPRRRPGAEGKRAALPAPGPERPRLRHLHARPRRRGHQLERRGAGDQGLHRRRDRRPPLLAVLHAGGSRGRRAGAPPWPRRCARASSRARPSACARTASASGPAW